jgi:hypothetical protein
MVPDPWPRPAALEVGQRPRCRRVRHSRQQPPLALTPASRASTLPPSPPGTHQPSRRHPCPTSSAVSGSPPHAAKITFLPTASAAIAPAATRCRWPAPARRSRQRGCLLARRPCLPMPPDRHGRREGHRLRLRLPLPADMSWQRGLEEPLSRWRPPSPGTEPSRCSTCSSRGPFAARELAGPRSSLPLGNTGRAANGTNALGSRCSGSRCRRCAHNASRQARPSAPQPPGQRHGVGDEVCGGAYSQRTSSRPIETPHLLPTALLPMGISTRACRQ